MNQSDLKRNSYMLRGSLSKRGYMRWWHSFCGTNRETGQVRTFFVEYFIMNPGLYTGSGRSKVTNPFEDQPVLGQHPYFKRRGMRPSYVMVKAGIYPDADGMGGKQISSFYPISSLKTAQLPFIMEVEDCFYSEDRISGYLDISDEEARHRCLMTDSGTIEWDLEIYKAVACHTGRLAHPIAQLFNTLDSYWHGEGVKSFFRGTVTLDGETYDVTSEESNGCCDKHWGRNFNRPWLQLNCSTLISEHTGKPLRHSVLSVNGCCPRFLFLPLRSKLLVQLTYTGEDFDFGFKPFLLSRCKWETKETNKRYIWHIIAQNKTAFIKISGSCTKEQMLALKYENPDGLVSRAPLLSGAATEGTIQIYRRGLRSRELLDTLHIQAGLCIYRNN